jgi:transposase
MERRTFTAEFKREAVRLATQAGNSKTEVANELGIHPNLLRAWVRQFAAGSWERTAGKPLKGEQQQEIERLRRELQRVKTERDILNKAVAYFAKDPREVWLYGTTSVDLAGSHDVSDASGVTRRVLRMAHASAEPTCIGGRSPKRPDSHELPGKRQHLWQPARMA